MSEQQFKAEIKGWTNVNLTGAHPVGNFECCEWALEAGVPLDNETLAVAEYQRRLIGRYASNSPLTVQRLSEWRNDWIQTFLQYKDDTVCLNSKRPLDLVVVSEIALEAQVPLDSDTKIRLAEAFPFSAIYRVQAFPLVSKFLGAIGGPQYDPNAITWYDDRATRVYLPAELQSLLPADTILSIQKCALQINRQEENGFFKVQERCLNGVLENQFGTKVPLNNWMNRGIPQCITVTIENLSLDLAYLVGVFDIIEGSVAFLNDDLMPKKAFEHVKGKSSKSLEIQFVKNIFNVMKHDSKERDAIQAIMNYLQAAVFVPERQKLSISSKAPRL